MQKTPIAQKLKNAAVILTGAAVIGISTLSFNSCGKLPMHDRMFAPQGQFSEKPFRDSLESPMGEKGEGSGKSPDCSGLNGPKLFPEGGRLWEAPSKSELPNQNLQVKPDTAIRK
ncbi:Uncharacterised protein [uncultured archaeon]|nr:Uncharacterised protein [uncultured archaeon]